MSRKIIKNVLQITAISLCSIGVVIGILSLTNVFQGISSRVPQFFTIPGLITVSFLFLIQSKDIREKNHNGSVGLKITAIFMLVCSVISIILMIFSFLK